MVWLTVVQGRMMERRGKEREKEGKGGREKESREITRRAFACMRAGEGERRNLPARSREQCSVAVLSSVCWPIRAEDDRANGQIDGLLKFLGQGNFSSKLLLYEYYHGVVE